MLIRKWIASGHGPAMLVALFLSLLAGAPAAAVSQPSGSAPAIEQTSSSQAIFIKRAHMLQALRAPQPTPFAAVIPGEFRLAAPDHPPSIVNAAQKAALVRADDAHEPYQPRAPPAA